MRWRIRFRILPVLVIVSMLSFMVRVGDFWTSLRHMGEAQAQEQVAAMPPPLPVKVATPATTAGKDGGPPLPAIADAKKTGSDAPVDIKTLTAKDDANGHIGTETSWKDATEEQYECSDTQEKLNQDLVKRREGLDRQAKELATRQALLEAAKKELDQKVTEMTNLRNEIKGMMGTLSDQEKARIGSLVKIYEHMKPDDAARIFNTLDMDVLLEVMGQMKETKSAPILAAMSSDRAKAVTVLLAQQKKLPDVTGVTDDAATP